MNFLVGIRLNFLQMKWSLNYFQVGPSLKYSWPVVLIVEDPEANLKTHFVCMLCIMDDFNFNYISH